jgi:hypothetical protein
VRKLWNLKNFVDWRDSLLLNQEVLDVHVENCPKVWKYGLWEHFSGWREVFSNMKFIHDLEL